MGLYVPALPVGSSHKLIGLFDVCDLHLVAVPQQLFATIIVNLFAIFLSQHVAADGQVTHQYRFGHGPGIVERRRQCLMLLASEASLTCIHPLPLMTVFWLIAWPTFRPEVCSAIAEIKF